MSPACPLCRETFAAHFAVRALSRARWRGPSFDAQAAKGSAGLAVLDLLGLSARRPEDLARFERTVRVEAFRSVAPEDLNPVEPFDPETGEWWEFHVGFREAPPSDVVPRAEGAVVNALNRSRHYSRAGVIPSTVR